LRSAASQNRDRPKHRDWYGLGFAAHHAAKSGALRCVRGTSPSFPGLTRQFIIFQKETTQSKRNLSMITEIAQIDVKPGSEKDFEAAIVRAEPIFRRCKGWKSFELHRGIEKPSRYRLHIKWETLENHTVDFRGSENFAEWRALVGPHFAAPPEVEHTNTVVSY
jgi:heme-degrading monooxygenase HmoA